MYALIYTEQYIFIQYFMYARLSIFDQKYNIPTLFPTAAPSFMAVIVFIIHKTREILIIKYICEFKNDIDNLVYVHCQ